MTRYSDEALLAMLRQAADRLGRIPRQADLRGVPGMPHPVIYARRFGSWAQAIRKAGIEHLPPARGYSRGEVLERLKAHYVQTGRFPSASELPVSYGVIRRHFGGMGGAREAFERWMEEQA